MGDRELGLGVAAENPLAESALSALIGQLDRIIAVLLDGNDGDGLPGNSAQRPKIGAAPLQRSYPRMRVLGLEGRWRRCTEARS